jgi:hypothetical protein
MILCCAGVRVNVAREPHRFFDIAVPLILPDQQIRDSAPLRLFRTRHAEIMGMFSQLSLAQKPRKWPCDPCRCRRSTV